MIGTIKISFIQNVYVHFDIAKWICKLKIYWLLSTSVSSIYTTQQRGKWRSFGRMIHSNRNVVNYRHMKCGNEFIVPSWCGIRTRSRTNPLYLNELLSGKLLKNFSVQSSRYNETENDKSSAKEFLWNFSHSLFTVWLSWCLFYAKKFYFSNSTLFDWKHCPLFCLKKKRQIAIYFESIIVL